MRTSSLFLLWVGLLFWVGCAGNGHQVEPQATPAPESDGARTVAPAVHPEQPPAEPEVTPAAITPASLYAECRERVENPQVEGECETDADCARAGCGQEICTSASAAAAGLMTTCEDRLCFQVLDTCGCQQGVCVWSLTDEVPQRKELAPLPLPGG